MPSHAVSITVCAKVERSDRLNGDEKKATTAPRQTAELVIASFTSPCYLEPQHSA
jgi:hypothetical protein